MTSPFEKLPIHPQPINRQASFGIAANTVDKITSWECPEIHPTGYAKVLAIRNIKKREEGKKISTCQENPTGWRYGHVTVIGFVKVKPGNSGFTRRVMFAVRCDCGRYELRQLDLILRFARAKKDDCCDVCWKAKQ